MFNFIAKTAINEEQIKTKLNLGMTNMELQLLNDFDYLQCQDYIEILSKFKNIKIHSLHSPFFKDTEFNIHDMYDDKNQKRMRKVIQLAEKIRKKFNKEKMIVVIHNKKSRSEYRGEYDKNLKIFRFFRKIVEEYPHIEISIENTTVISKNLEGDLQFSNGYDETFSIVELFNKETNSKNFYATIDTCHMMISKRFIDLLIQNGIPAKVVNYDDFFEKEHLINNIHLTNGRGFGFGEMYHGDAFRDTIDDKNELIKIMSILKHKNITDIVLEINEIDFSKCQNLKTTLETIYKIEKEATA